ncbi:MAG TPA: ABC transporter permease [Polyangiaceae bacterium]|nr:ABC transporter permease [Polyangiaceae bacterium]
MDLGKLTLRNARRSPFRGMLTIVAVAISLVAFILIRAVSSGWTEQVKQTPANRVVTRHKMGWQGTLPVHYVQSVAGLAGVHRVMGARWAGLSLPGDRMVEFESTAVDAEAFSEMHYELKAPPEQKAEFVADRRGAMVSAELARELGWKVGDILHFKTQEPGQEVVLTVSAIFESARKGFARRVVYFHWAYWNELQLPGERDRINIVVAEVDDPSQGARTAQSIDMMFDATDASTLSQEDQAVNAQLVGEFSAILTTLDYVSIMILGVVLLIIGNTQAMAVRERRKEYGTLRAIGFPTRDVMLVVLGESVALGLVAGSAGLLISYPLVTRAASQYLEETLRLAPLEISPTLALVTLCIGGVLGALGAVFPAYRLSRIQIVEALAHVG